MTGRFYYPGLATVREANAVELSSFLLDVSNGS